MDSTIPNGSSSTNNNTNNDTNNNTNNNNITTNDEVTRRRRIRSLVKDIAKRVVPRQLITTTSSYAQPDAIAEVLKEATFRAVDEALQYHHHHSQASSMSQQQQPRKYGTPPTTSMTTTPRSTSNTSLWNRNANNNNNNNDNNAPSSTTSDADLEALIGEAFGPVEQSLDNLEQNLVQARMALQSAKQQAKEAVTAVQAAALAQVQGAASAVKKAEEVASRKAVAEIYATANHVDVESLAYEDVDFATSEMTPPFLDDDQCLVPGEPVVRVEKAPENSRRIFAGIDIMASVDTVWDVLTDYANLQNVVPNLEVNQVLQMFEGKTDLSDIAIDESKSDLEQCKQMANQLRGAVLKQVGKVRPLMVSFQDMA